MTPLRQFKGVPAEVIRKAEGKQFVSELSRLQISNLIVSSSLAVAPLLRLGELVESILVLTT